MSVTAGWDNPEKTIYRFTLVGRWTLPELHQERSQFKIELARVNYPVVSLFDMRHARIAPSNNIFEAGLLAFSERIINEDIIVVMSGSQTLRRTANTFIGILNSWYPERGLNTLLVNNEQEADSVIKQHWRKHKRHGYNE